MVARGVPLGSLEHELKCAVDGMREIADQVSVKELTHHVGLCLLEGLVIRHQITSEVMHDLMPEQQ